MGNLLAYSGIVTKVRAMQAKLLTDEDFQNGVRDGTGFDAVGILQGTGRI